MRHIRVAAFLTTLAFVSACEPEKVEPELTLTASPRTLDGISQTSTIRVIAADDTGKAGTGTVRLSSTVGSFKEPVEVELANGEGEATFSCARAMDPLCTGSARITGEWVVSGKLITANVNLTITPAAIPDAGLMLTAARPSIAIGFSQSSELVATYLVDGTPTAGTQIALTTTQGAVVFADGGAYSPTATDSAGQVHALLVDTGAPGNATVTATGPMSKTATASVTITRPDAGLTVMSDRNVLTVGFDEQARITVTSLLDGRAVAGRPLLVETSVGTLLETDGGAFTSPALTDAAGKIEALLTDNGQPGTANVTATDALFNKTASAMVQLSRPDAGVFVTTPRNRIYVGVNDSTLVTARLVTNGAPAINRQLNIATNLGELSYADGGVFNGMGTTDSAGNVQLELRETGTDGVATVTATDPQSMRTGSTNINILRIGTITYTSTTCGGTPCTLMGIANSGFNTQASVRFTVRDASTTPAPVAGVRVTFTLNNAPSGTTATASGITDAAGNVDAVVTSGDSIGSFTLTATVIPGVSTSSPTIGVRGAKPTNNGFQLQCAKVNLPAYRSSAPPLNLSTTCTIILVDRNNNPIGKGTTVQLLTEAGSITASVSTNPYTPMGSNEGRGTVPFSTMGVWPVQDVPPLVANPTQYPFALLDEPTRMDGALTRNPRDALVTVIAYTDGEEWFAESNGNGVQDGTEQFHDQGEPFVDKNDNDVWDPTEVYVDVDGNGAWTGPNGVWDASAKVWTKAYILYSDAVATGYATPNPFNVPKGGMTSVEYYGTDLNGNRVESATMLTMVRTGTRGTFTFVPASLQDGVGFGLEPRYLTNQTGTGPCTPTTLICVYRTIFSTWPSGYLGRINMTGVAVTDMTSGQNATAAVRATTVGLPVEVTASGFVQ